MFILAFLVRSTNCRRKNVRTCFFWTIEFIKGIRFSNHVSGALHTSYFHQCRCKLQRNIWNYHPILIKLRKKSKYIDMSKEMPQVKKDEEISKSIWIHLKVYMLFWYFKLYARKEVHRNILLHGFSLSKEITFKF